MVKKKDCLRDKKNNENKIKGENKKESEPIKNEEQLEVLKDESTIADKKPKEIMLLKDKLDFIFKNFDSILKVLEKIFLKSLLKMKKD